MSPAKKRPKLPTIKQEKVGAWKCEKLKELEDKWICRLGTFHGQFGLNERDEMKMKNRVGY